MNIKWINDPKLWQALTTALLGYFGYTQVQEHRAADVDVEVHIPEDSHHSHPQHSHKDWQPLIEKEIEKARRMHSNQYHGGD